MSDSIRIDTPESVDLSLDTAGIGSRIFASLIDAAIQWGVAGLLALVTWLVGEVIGERVAWSQLTDSVMIAILLLALGLLFSAYRLLFEAIWNGQTVGKRVAGIRVVQANGLPVTFLQVLIRNLIRIVDFLPGFYALGMVSIMVTQRSQRLGDLTAGTVVIRSRSVGAPQVPTALSQTAAVDLTPLRESVRKLTEEDLQVVRTFWERRAALEPEVRDRIAAQIVRMLITKMGWSEPWVFIDDLAFIEKVLYVRTQM